MKRFLVVLLALVALGSLLANLLMYRRYSTSRPVVSMKGGTITIKDYRDALEFAHGREVLSKLVLSKMVRAAAQQAGVSPTQGDIDHRIDFIKRRDPKRVGAAMNDPAKMPEFTRGLETDLALENLTIQGIEVNDAEVAAFYQAARALFTVPEQTEMTIVAAENDVDARTAEQLLSKNIDAATIANQPRLKVDGVTTQINYKQMTQAEQNDFSNRIKTLKKGSVFIFATKKIEGAKRIVVRINSQKTHGVIPFSEAKTDVIRFCRIAKASKNGTTSQSVLLDLFRKSNPRFDSEKYSNYFAPLLKAAQTPGKP